MLSFSLTTLTAHCSLTNASSISGPVKTLQPLAQVHPTIVVSPHLILLVLTRSNTALIPLNMRCSAIIGIIFYAGLLAIVSTTLSMNTSSLSAAVLRNNIQLKSILLAPLGWMLALACASFWFSQEHKVKTIIDQPTLNPARPVRLNFCFLGLLMFETRT